MPVFTTRRHALLVLGILAACLPSNDSFSIGSSGRAPSLLSTSLLSISLVADRNKKNRISKTSLRISSYDKGETVGNDINGTDKKGLAAFYTIAKLATSITWIITAYVALSFHPDPKFKDCTLRHNLLTMSQAYAFPLPVLCASFDALNLSAKADKLESPTSRRLGVAVGVASFWLAASMAIPPKFAFGYDLYQKSHKVIAATVHAITGLFTMGVVLRTNAPNELFRGLMDSPWKLGPNRKPESDSFETNSSMLATGCVGLLWFTILPIVSPYPLATIPTILGKRLSRVASAFTFLGSVMVYCLKEGDADPVPNTDDSSQNDTIKRTLSRGLAIGSGSHLLLIALKLIGVDGGGYVFPGRGLWDVYPAMMSVPFSAGVSMLIHAIVCHAGCSIS